MQWNWWSVLVRGLAALAFGVIALVWPDITTRVLLVVFGIFVLVDGIFEIFGAMKARQSEQKWFMSAFRGLIGIAVGLVALLWPSATAKVVLYIIAIWAIVSGLGELFIAYKFPLSRIGKVLLLGGGVISIVFGALLIAFPEGGATDLVWLIGAYAIVLGVILSGLAVEVKRLQKGMPVKETG